MHIFAAIDQFLSVIQLTQISMPRPLYKTNDINLFSNLSQL